jgi:hypothetical protein
MALTKRVLSIALALLLGLGLLAPMASAAVDPNAPVITKQPSSSLKYIKTGKSFTLTVQADLLIGAEGTLSYAWYESPGNQLIATGSAARITATASNGSMFPSSYYYVVITNTYNDENGDQQTASIQSDTVEVGVVNSIMGAGLASFQASNFLNSILLFPLNLFTYMLFVCSSIAYTFIYDFSQELFQL